MSNQEHAFPPRTVPLESYSSAMPIQDNSDRGNTDSDWGGTCLEVVDSPQDLTAPKRPDLDLSSASPSLRISLPPLSIPQEPPAGPVPHPEVLRRETVQPLDVLNTAQPPPKARSGFTLESVLAPAEPVKLPIFKSSFSSDRGNGHEISKLLGSEGGKVAKHSSEASASSDAALTNIIRTALSGSTTQHVSEAASTNGNSDRNILPSGRPSLPSGNNASEGSVKSSDSSPPSTLSLSDATDVTESEELKKAEEILKTIRHLGYTLQKDPSLSPKIQNLGSVASNKSEKKVTCGVCKKFQGRPCELRYILPVLSHNNSSES